MTQTTLSVEPIEYSKSTAWLVISLAFWLIVGAILIDLALVSLIVGIMIGRALITYKTTKLVLDEQGVTLRKGLVRVSEQRLPRGNIHDVTMSTNPLGRVFDFGTIALSVGNDRNRIKVAHLAGCHDLKQRLEPLLAK